ncbi:thiamine pyrophosphate-dependent enzyme [Tomitella cavernea]|uniref:thiamine pyrophosphate-dependent enzyme n=1 Tax=Tomitella cavernea TaxID=1387982 RepID=UPI0035590D98
MPTSSVMAPEAGSTAAPALKDRLRDILDDHEALLGLYRDLAVLRRIDEQCLALARQGALALWAPIVGQEAVLVGAARAADRHDHLFISYRESLMAHLRGVPPEQVLPMWRGSALGGWDPAEYGITNPAIIVGAHGLHATGYAMAAALDGSQDRAIAFFGDGATSQGDLNEALNFAATTTAPVVFFCTNNQFAISVPIAQQTAVQPAQRAHGFGIPSLRVDGNDVLAVLAATRTATAHVQAGGGPYFVEAVTYRLGPHTTNDDPTRYRSAAELEAWRARDPVERMRGFLADSGLITESDADVVRSAADDAAQRYRTACAELPEPDAAGIFEHVYAAPHPLIVEERHAYADYLASLGGAAATAVPAGPSTGKEVPR